MAENEANEKCAHPPCNCTSSDESDYCSAYCENAGDTEEIKCSCGHPNCS